MAAILKTNPDFLTNLSDDEIQQLAFNFYVEAAATPMTAAEYLAYQKTVAETIRQGIINDTAAPASLKTAASNASAWQSAYLSALTTEGLLRSEDSLPAIHVTPQFTSLLATIAAGTLAMPAGQSYVQSSTAATITNFFAKLRTYYGSTDSAYGSSGLPAEAQFDAGLSNATQFEAFKISVGQNLLGSTTAAGTPSFGDVYGVSGSQSANVVLTGPSGAGTADEVPANTALPYSLTFTNPSSATAPVEHLQVVVNLDDHLDPRSFRLAGIQLGTQFVNLPTDRGSYTGTFDYTDTAGYILQVTAGVDVTTNQVVYDLTAIDPATGLPLQSSTLGLLLPGQSGTIGFTAEVTDGSPTGTMIAEGARVTFDGGAPMYGNVVANTVDGTPPTTSFAVTQKPGNVYVVTWMATDDAGGSGVADSTVYVSLSGGPYVPVLIKSNAGTYTFTAPAGTTAQFLVLSSDKAGNVESAPAGVSVPPYNPTLNLGALPVAPVTTPVPLPVLSPPSASVSNSLFTTALLGVPNAGNNVASGFSTLYAPFALSSFVTGVSQSNAGIGPLAIGFSPDGQFIYVSGGPGRNVLYRFGYGGGAASAATTLATLPDPIYDLVFDAAGRLWATTGGGPLLQLDPNSGAIVGSYGNGIQTGIAFDKNNGLLYVSTGTGVQTFNPTTDAFSSFSSTRVDGLAIAPDGTLWGASWPNTGEILEFTSRGQAQIAVAVPNAVGLTFGQTGTALAGLLLVNRSDGILTAVDLASFETTPIATGGTRGDITHVGPDGRIYLTQGDRVDVLFPVTAPQVIATDPVNNATIAVATNEITVTFDQGVIYDSATDAASVTDLANYTLTDTATGDAVPVSLVTYDPSTNTAELWFDSLQPDTYALTVGTGIKSLTGQALKATYTSNFRVLQDFTSALPITFSNTRANVGGGTLLIDVTVQNPLATDVNGPVELVLTGLTADEVLNADGTTADGHPYFLLVGTGSTLSGGTSTTVRTLQIVLADSVGDDLAPEVLATLPSSAPPRFSSVATTSARVGSVYTYDANAAATDGSAVSFVLLSGPTTATLNAATGVLTWTPKTSDAGSVTFDIRAYTATGSHADQVFTVTVAGVAQPPVLAPIANTTIAAGVTLTIPVSAIDPSGLALTYSVSGLPAGAVYDPTQQAIRWQSTPTSAGLYTITVTANDGIKASSESFTLTVTPTAQAPVLTVPGNKTIKEGQAVSLQLSAVDPEGKGVTYASADLPPGATLNPTTGLFTWTPAYNQHGTYTVYFTATNGDATGTGSVTLTVTNVNGPVTFVPLSPVVVQQGQTLSLQVQAIDPNATFVASGVAGSAVNSPTLTFTATGLPAGATFDANQLLTFTPGFTQSGSYTITFTVHNDGDGTGTQNSATMTLQVTVAVATASPVVNPITNVTVDGNATDNIQVSAVSPHGHAITLSVPDLPAFATFVDHGDGTGTIHAAPGELDGGNYVLTVVATDATDPNHVLTGQQQFVVTVNVPVPPPVLAFIGPKIAIIGSPLTFGVVATDRSQDALTFTATGLPAGATLTPSATYGQAVFNFTPTGAGSYSITITVTDATDSSKTSSQTFTLVARAVDQAPVLTPVGPQNGAEGSAFSLQLSATDPDGDTLTYSAVGLPAGATLNPQTGLFTWTPAFGTAGTYSIPVTVSDGALTSGQTISLTIAQTARAPVLNPLPDLFVNEGTEIAFTVSGVDPQGGPLSYSSPLVPNNATLDSSSGLFTFTPAYGQAGAYTLTFSATDAAGLTSSETVNVTVLKVNRPPLIGHISGHQLIVGQTFTLQLPITPSTAGDAVAVSVDGLPDDATFNPNTNTVTWTPTAADVGNYGLQITATEGGQTAVQSVSLTVATTATPPSVLIVLTPSFPVTPGQAVTIQAVASGIADIGSVVLTVDGSVVTLDANGRAIVHLSQTGHNTIVATATDVDGNVGIATADLKVLDPTDTTAPTLTLGGFSDGDDLFDPTTITATVGSSNLDTYTLSYAPATANGQSTVLASGTSPVNGAAVATIDPATLANGSYVLTLTATDIAGRTTTVTRRFDVALASNAGAYQTGGVDLPNAALDGVPVEFGRYYDSTQAATTASFGYGWHSSLLDPQIATNVAATGPVPGLPAPLTSSTRLYINLPTGRRAGFTFAPQSVTAGGATYYVPAWTADAGVTATLSTTAGVKLTIVNGAFYVLGTGLPYNPANSVYGDSAYTLTTTADGTAYHYSAAGKLTTIVGTNGVTLTVADSGITAPDGESITFARDTADRLVRLVAPGNVEISYVYSTAGVLTRVIGETAGLPAFYGYDSGHRLTLSQTLSSGTAIAYDASGKFTGSADAAAHTPTLAAPTVVSTTVNTAGGVATIVNLGALVTNAGGAVTFVIGNVTGGTFALSADGATGTFTPAAGFSGTAAFTFVADNGDASAAGVVTLTVANNAPIGLTLSPRDPDLGLGQSVQLTVAALFADGSTNTLPLTGAVYTSSNPSVVQVTNAGVIIGIGNGTAVITVVFNGITAATAVNVGAVAALNVSFFPVSYSLVPGQQRQLVISEQNADGSTSDVSSAAAGAVYYVSNPAIATVTADGLLTATGTGLVQVTMLFGGYSSVATFTVATPAVGSTNVPAYGGTLTSSDGGVTLGFGAGAVPAGTGVTLSTGTEAQEPYSLPYGWSFVGGFNLNIANGIEPATADPLSVAIPARAWPRVPSCICSCPARSSRARTRTTPAGRSSTT